VGLAASTIGRWRSDPVAFVRENFGIAPDAWQVEALRAFADPALPLISMQACAGPGKTALLSWCAWHFLSCWGEPGDHPKGFAVAVSGDNLKANLWPELSKWQQKSPYLLAMFTWSAERIFASEHKATWFLEARSWNKSASPEEQANALSGLHGGYVLALIDESGAIPPAVARKAEQALSTKPTFGKVVQAGNPLSRSGMLYAAAQSKDWHVIRITGDPDDPLRSPRIDLEWARRKIAAHGRNDPWVKAYILGEFPDTAINALLSVDEVRDSMRRAPRGHDFEHAAKVIGVDVAREGLDQSAIILRQGVMCWPPTLLRGASSIHGAGVVAQLATREDADAIFADNTGGFGGGWVDQLRQLGHSPIPVHFAGTPDDPRFANKRAEMWWRMAEWVREGGALPDCPELVAELCEPTYTFKGDRLILEPKDDVKERIGRSPDIADALALTFASQVAPRKFMPDWELAKHASRRIRHGGDKWNPFRPAKR
jgi:phage terminase large subunit